MFTPLTPEHSLLRRSIPLRPPGPPPPCPLPYLARHPTQPPIPPVPSQHPACHPTLPATTLPTTPPCWPSQPWPRRHRDRCDVLVPSSSFCEGYMCGVQVNLQPHPIFYTHHQISYLPTPIFYVPYLIFYVPYLIFYVPPLIFYIPYLIFHVPPPNILLTCEPASVDTRSARPLPHTVLVSLWYSPAQQN